MTSILPNEKQDTALLAETSWRSVQPDVLHHPAVVRSCSYWRHIIAPQRRLVITVAADFIWPTLSVRL